MTGYIYAVECCQRIKIGYSKKPERRFSKIASDAPFPCQLLGYWSGDKAEELAIHEMFHHVREYGEWFNADAQLLAFVAENVMPTAKSSRKVEPGHPLTEYAARTGRSITEIAKSASVSRMTLYRLVRGEQNARISLLEQISAATDGEVPASAFLPRSKQGERA